MDHILVLEADRTERAREQTWQYEERSLRTSMHHRKPSIHLNARGKAAGAVPLSSAYEWNVLRIHRKAASPALRAGPSIAIITAKFGFA
jgi:hypothetical protein